MTLNKISLLLLLLIGVTQAARPRAEVFKAVEVDAGGDTCRCFFVLVAGDSGECKFSVGRCQVSCSGAAEGVVLTGESGNEYTLELSIAEGVVTFEDCKLESMFSFG